MNQNNSYNPNLVNVTDISSYLYCPRKFYLEKVKGLRQPPTQPMIEGKIRHQVRETFSNSEQEFIEDLKTEDITKQKITQQFQELLDNIITRIFSQESNLIRKFSINPTELKQKILKSMENDIILRSDSINKTIQKGFSGTELWLNLEPKYLSELRLSSEKLGLKGRADRIMIEPDKITPFELKTRTAEKVWPSDEIQLTAYAMLLEEKYNQQIPFGILEAGDQKFEIPITQSNKTKVLKLIREVKELLNLNNPNNQQQSKDIDRPSSFAKCQKCFFEEECDKI